MKKKFDFLLHDLEKNTVCVYNHEGKFVEEISMKRTGNEQRANRGFFVECSWNYNGIDYTVWVRDFIHKVGSTGESEFYGK